MMMGSTSGPGYVKTNLDFKGQLLIQKRLRTITKIILFIMIHSQGILDEFSLFERKIIL